MGNVASSFGGQTCPRIIVLIYDVSSLDSARYQSDAKAVENSPGSVLSLDSAKRGVMYQPEAKARGEMASERNISTNETV